MHFYALPKIGEKKEKVRKENKPIFIVLIEEINENRRNKINFMVSFKKRIQEGKRILYGTSFIAYINLSKYH